MLACDAEQADTARWVDHVCTRPAAHQIDTHRCDCGHEWPGKGLPIYRRPGWIDYAAGAAAALVILAVIWLVIVV